MDRRVASPPIAPRRGTNGIRMVNHQGCYVSVAMARCLAHHLQKPQRFPIRGRDRLTVNRLIFRGWLRVTADGGTEITQYGTAPAEKAIAIYRAEGLEVGPVIAPAMEIA